MNIKLIASLILLGLLLNNVAFSDDLSEKQISEWIDKGVGKVEITNIAHIKLENGEDAYLASAEFPDQNYLARYVLARPALKKAMVIQDYGGRYNKISILRESGTSVLVIGSAGSGQGFFDITLFVVTFNGWEANVIYTTSMSSNSHNCGYEEGEEGILCRQNEIFLNPLEIGSDNIISFVETVVSYEGTNLDNLKPSVASKILSFPFKEYP